MGSGFGGITCSGSSGSHTYSTIAGRGSMPVNYVSFYDVPFDLAASSWNGLVPRSENLGLGFRVASLPEPSSTLLMIAGMLGPAGWRKRGA